MDGFEGSFHIGHITRSHLSGADAQSDGIYDPSQNLMSAEIILLIPPGNQTRRNRRGWIKRIYKEEISANFAFDKADTSFYAVPCGIPTYKFNIPIRSNRTYTKRVITYGDRTVYELFDNFGNHDVYIDNSPGLNRTKSWLDRCSVIKRLHFNTTWTINYTINKVGTYAPPFTDMLEFKNKMFYDKLRVEGIITGTK